MLKINSVNVPLLKLCRIVSDVERAVIFFCILILCIAIWNPVTYRKNTSGRLDTHVGKLNLVQLIALLEILPNFPLAYQKWNPNDTPLDPTLKERLGQVGYLSQNYGLSAAELVSNLQKVEALKYQIQSQWDEFSTPAKSTSKLLTVLPIITHLFALSIGIKATEWLITSSFGIALLVFASILTFASFRIQARDPFKTPRTIAITSNRAMGLVFVTTCIWQPSIPGVVFALLISLLVGEFWALFQQQSRKERLRERKFQNIWDLGIVIAALDTGMSWNSVLELLEIGLQGLEKVEIAEIRRRIEQGATPEEAFLKSELWSAIGMSLTFAQSEGARITPVLRALRDNAIHEYQSAREIRVRKQSQLLTVSVSALQLPAFIAVGLVPIVAEPLLGIIEQFSSTVLVS